MAGSARLGSASLFLSVQPLVSVTGSFGTTAGVPVRGVNASFRDIR